MAVRETARVRLRDLRNLGPASERALHAVGIETPEQLDELGPAAAYVRLREADSRVSRTFLWALAGAALDLDWRELPDQVKADLLREVG